MNDNIKSLLNLLTEEVDKLPNVEAKVTALNVIRKSLHEISPMKHNPIDYVEWVKGGNVKANDYNPNSVAPPEMELLYTSIKEDGYTQPIVSSKANELSREVVDGFHRNRIGKERQDIKDALHGYLPLVSIRQSKKGVSSRMASTIRHNRARGTHSIKGMSNIVLELTTKGWDNNKICEHLGMELDEVIRLKQATGLKQAFANHTFSKTWTEFVTNNETE